MFMRKIAAGAAAVIALSTGTVAFTATPVAASHDCVTDNEWRKVRSGWTMERVHNVFDVTGRVTSVDSYGRNRDVYREYRACNRPGSTYMSINFDNYSNGHGMRLYNKSFSRYF